MCTLCVKLFLVLHYVIIEKKKMDNARGARQRNYGW